MKHPGRRKAIAALLALGTFAVPVRAQHGRAGKVLGLGGKGDLEFEWLPTECADERYPMQLIQGDFHCPGNRIVEVPCGKIVNNGWGEVGSRRLIGEAFKPVPERLELAWFSFAEDRIFGGTVDLPRAALVDLFRAGFQEPETGRSTTWSKIIVGMGLGGWTSVWLSGGKLVREVARAQLPATEVDWSRILENPAIPRAEYVRSKLRSRLSEASVAHLAKHGPPVGTWARYSRRYRWRMLLAGLHEPESLLLRSFNGERSFHDFAGRPAHDLEIAPKHLQITWQDRSGGRLLTEIRLDEEEVFDAFDKASAGSMTKLRVEFGTRRQIALSVESAAGRRPLTRSRIKLWSLS